MRLGTVASVKWCLLQRENAQNYPRPLRIMGREDSVKKGTLGCEEPDSKPHRITGQEVRFVSE